MTTRNALERRARSGTRWTFLFAASLALACSPSYTGPSEGTGGTAAALGGQGGSATGGSGNAGGSVASGGAIGSSTSAGAGQSGAGDSMGGASGGIGGLGGSSGGVAALGGASGSPSPATGGAAGEGGPGKGGNAGAGGAAAGAPNGGASGSGGASAGGPSTPGGSGGDGGSGGSGGVAGGPSGGAAGFDPCPAVDPCKILPLGDSITDGIGFSGGYRVELFAKAVADGKNITFVGGSMNGPNMVAGLPFPRAHEGHSGWTIEQIDGIVPSPALDPEPHIVLLHIGTNDMYRNPNGAPDRLGGLIDQILDELPDALLVVSTIIPFPQSQNAVSAYNSAIPPLIEERAKAGKHILLVDQFEGFPTSELGDGVHPNQAGYARMAGVWYEAIAPYLH